jgi:hypothetical protein
MQIHEAMVAIMRDVGAISKDRKNTQQNYAFRGVDDVYAALHDILAKHGVFTMPEVMEDRSEERTTKSGGALIYRILRIRYHFIAADGSEVQSIVIGEGMDSGDKASNKAMSVAHKYALLQAFCIPTEDAKDPENDNPEPAPKRTEPKAETESEKECRSLAVELKLADDEKAKLWKDSDHNWSNMLVVLKARKMAATLDAATEGGKE